MHRVTMLCNDSAPMITSTMNSAAPTPTPFPDVENRTRIVTGVEIGVELVHGLCSERILYRDDGLGVGQCRAACAVDLCGEGVSAHNAGCTGILVVAI